MTRQKTRISMAKRTRGCRSYCILRTLERREEKRRRTQEKRDNILRHVAKGSGGGEGVSSTTKDPKKRRRRLYEIIIILIIIKVLNVQDGEYDCLVLGRLKTTTTLHTRVGHAPPRPYTRLRLRPNTRLSSEDGGFFFFFLCVREPRDANDPRK